MSKQIRNFVLSQTFKSLLISSLYGNNSLYYYMYMHNKPYLAF